MHAESSAVLCSCKVNLFAPGVNFVADQHRIQRGSAALLPSRQISCKLIVSASSKPCQDEMETKSQVLVEVHVSVDKEVIEGADGHEAADNKHCKSLLLVAPMKEQAAVLSHKDSLPPMKLDDQEEIGKCLAMLHSLPGDGNGKAPGAHKLNAPLSGAPQADLIAELPCNQLTPELVVAKQQQGCIGNADGDGKAAASNEAASLPVLLPVSEDDHVRGDTPTVRTPPQRPPVAPECVEVDDVVQTMRNILFNLTYADNAHLNPDDEAKVRDLLEYHPKAAEKTGSGIDFIKVKRHSTFKDARCFWVVRTDGTETDFSYHKCLKGKVARENPSFLDRYDAIYRAPKRQRMVLRE